MKTQKIIVFTQPDSLPCEAVKLILKIAGPGSRSTASFPTTRPGANWEEKYRSQSLPTVVIGEDVVISSGPERIDQLLGE